MAVRPIIKFPDPLLRTVADPVELFDSDLRNLAGDLIDTMHAAPGIGITAPHIGILKRLVVIQVPPAAKPAIYANPSIVEASTETIRHPEGSVSMPGVTEDVERHARVRVRYQDLEAGSSSRMPKACWRSATSTRSTSSTGSSGRRGYRA